MMSNTARGVAPLLGYAVLAAATDVYAGNKLQALSPTTVAAVAFTLAAAYFLGTDMARKGVTGALRPLRTHRHDVVALNLVTAVTWLTLLYALKYIEPAIVNVVAFAIGPALTVLIGPVLRRGSTVLRAEVWVAVGILALIGVLMWGSATGLSALRELEPGHAVVGLGMSVVCGLGCTANVIYSKRLSDGGLSPLSTLAMRYLAMVAVSWVFVAFSDEPRIMASVVPGAVIALVGVGLPNYLNQVGIKHVEPITASLFDTLSPVCAFLLQLFDGRLQPSGLTLAGVIGITVLVGVGVVARHRHETRPVPVPVPVGVLPAEPAVRTP